MSRKPKMLGKYIDNAMIMAGTEDRYKICMYLCMDLEKRFGDKLEDKLKNMGIETTGKILEAIDNHMQER